jgi:hypothetical protein
MNLKNVMRKKIYVYVSPVTVFLHYVAMMCIYVIYKCLSWTVINSKVWISQTKLSMGSC